MNGHIWWAIAYVFFLYVHKCVHIFVYPKYFIIFVENNENKYNESIIKIC